MIQVYKVFSGYEDIDTECFFIVDSDSHTRGHPFKLEKIRGNAVRQCCEAYLIIFLSHCK